MHGQTVIYLHVIGFETVHKNKQITKSQQIKKKKLNKHNYTGKSWPLPNSKHCLKVCIDVMSSAVPFNVDYQILDRENIGK